MPDGLLRLYPGPQETLPVEGLYLQHRLHTLGTPGQPLVYSNYVTSLDGRIGLPATGRHTHQVPPAIANPRDWRLFQELGAQADVLITSARYFRQLAAGEAQDLLPVGPGPAFADLRRWRTAEGLRPQPDVAVLSASLDIPVAALETCAGRRVRVFTGAQADPHRAAVLAEAGVEIHRAGPGARVNGAALVAQLAGEGYRSIYAIAGPAVLHTLVSAGILDRLYLTLAHSLLGGDVFDSLLRGAVLTPPQALELGSLYYDPLAPAGCGQLLGCYTCRPPAADA